MSDQLRGSASLHEPMDVVIHIGAPKTGSSAIQRFCIKNRRALRDAGYYYPKHAVDKNGVSGGHSILAGLLRREKVGLAKLYFRYLLLKARLQGKTLLLSSEGFCRSAARFAPLLEGLNVWVVGWFRHPIEAFVSNYNQSIKRHFRTETIASLFDGMSPRRRPPHLSGKRLHRWADVVGDERCTFIPYLKPTGVDDEQPIEERWLQVIGVAPEQFANFAFDAKRVNRSYVPDALELKRLLNVVLSADDRATSRAIDWALQDYSDQQEEDAVELGVHLEPEHVKRLSHIFSRANRRLVERFPAMAPLLDKDDLYLRQAKEARVQSLELEAVLVHLDTLCPSEMELIRSRVKQCCQAGQSTTPEMQALARLLKVEMAA